MNDWRVNLLCHWPHDRFTVGTEFIKADEAYPYNTLSVFLFVITLEFDWN